MEQAKPANKKALWYVVVGVVLVALIVIFAVVYGNSNQPVAGSKTITVQIVNGDSTETKTIQTDAEYLRGALEQENLVEGTESEHGLYVLTVNGITADESQQQWWCFTKGGEQVNTGVDSTPIADGDTFEITLTTGW